MHLIDQLAKIFRSILLLAFAAMVVGACSSVKKVALEFDTISILRQSEIFSKHHVGFSLYDVEANQFLSNHNASLLFTPASNTKLLTMYVVLSNFNDSIPGLLYQQRGRNLTIEAIGEPTLLLNGFQHQPVFNLLAESDSLTINFPEELAVYGSGWSWDDYVYDYQVQRSWLPVYGNKITVKKDSAGVTIFPEFFNDFVEVTQEDSVTKLSRERYFNTFSLVIPDDTTTIEQHIPFEYSDELLTELLADTLPVSHIQIEHHQLTLADTLFSQQVDTVLASMLKPSDNYLAEQLLLLCAWNNGFTEIDAYIDYVKTVHLNTLNEMVWVDGSGLSRYNLISPNDQVRLLKKSIDDFGWDRITQLLPAGGEGTLRELYQSDQPFIYAKTGTLSNNHNLSGFLVTRSGKKLIFSLMNNHYTRPTKEIKSAMEELLTQIVEAY